MSCYWKLLNLMEGPRGSLNLYSSSVRNTEGTCDRHWKRGSLMGLNPWLVRSNTSSYCHILMNWLVWRKINTKTHPSDVRSVWLQSNMVFFFTSQTWLSMPCVSSLNHTQLPNPLLSSTGSSGTQGHCHKTPWVRSSWSCLVVLWLPTQDPVHAAESKSMGWIWVSITSRTLPFP